MDPQEYLGMEWDILFSEEKLNLVPGTSSGLTSLPAKMTEVPGTRLSLVDSPDVVDPVLHHHYGAIVGALS